ncbi:MAG: HAD family hydrolase [Nitrospirae bacterium]|nr:MAG: HAD family hydrolase [Nitrospirota bacterium]
MATHPWPELLIFDLDGTLIDSKEDIAAALNQTLAESGLPQLAREVIYAHVGNGVFELIRGTVAAAGGDEGQAEAVLGRFMEVYEARCLERTRLYPGAHEVRVRFAGVPMALITNKSMRFTRPILAGLGIAAWFEPVLARDSLARCKPHPEPLLHCLARHGADPARTWMVGDGAVDIEAGRAAGVRTVGCLYGFRTEAELRAARPDALIRDLRELPGLFGPGPGLRPGQ